MFNRKPFSPVALLCPASLALLAFSASSANAAVLRHNPTAPQPGDVVTLTLYPQVGERIVGAGMAAFDTAEVKFYTRPNGTARALVGLPFDRRGGSYLLQARVRISKTRREPGGLQNTVESEQIVSTLVRARERHFPTQHISMRSSTAGTMSRTDALRREKLLVQNSMKNSYPTPLWSGSWFVPTSGRSSSSYGRRRYVNGRWWGQHNGADIKAPTGAPVGVSNSGRVVLSQLLPTLRGNCIVVDHGCNVFSIYMHLSQRLVKVGDGVKRGQVIGRVGATGFSTGPHLHWEVRIGWEPVDPARITARGLPF
jgi:murein DD-endopeptidase MepM/ murein hydrolase activator NlpD